MGVRKHPAAWTNKSIQNANKCVRCAQGGYIVFIFYKVCKSLFPRPAARYPVRLAISPCADLAQVFPVMVYPVTLDTIKAGLFFPAL